ncbi:MAG: AAA family ATPase, partial [Chloroflexota bacterium]
FLRPRRFGKSLWLSTLMNYYDIAKTDDFERLFGHLAIGQNPTPSHNSYMVMKWDFSGVESHGSIQEIRQSLYDHINEEIANFAEDYAELLRSTVRIHPDNALSSFSSVVSAVRRSRHKLYLFIDEYDNFANEVMMVPKELDKVETSVHRDRYLQLVSGEGLLKTLFKKIKTAGSGAGMDRLFITGVSPILMNDMTSGPNVNEDITWLPYFNDLCGFTEPEVHSIVDRMVEADQLPADKVAEVMGLLRNFYNGSRFVTFYYGNPEEKDTIQNAPKIYNPISTFYFLRHIQRFGQYPEDMMDSNLAPDYNKLIYISGYTKGQTLMEDALDDEKMVAITTLNDRWGVLQILDAEQQKERLAGLLCYLGGLTIVGRQSDAKLRLEIPNLIMRKLYAERILKLTFTTADKLDNASIAANQLFTRGNIEPLCTFVAKHLLEIYDNRDIKHINELTFKTLFIALLAQNNLYIMDSEPAIRRRYGDLIMMIRPEMRHYAVFDLLIEFKYVRYTDLKVGQHIPDGDEVRKMSKDDLLAKSAVKRAFNDAKKQLQDYRKTLTDVYGNALKLRTYTVVAVGVDLLLHEEVD